MRPIDADALIDKLDIMISNAILSDTAIHYALVRELIAEQPTIEPEVLLIPKEVSATDIDKLTEMIKGSLLQAYPNDVMFTAVRHGHWISVSSFDACGGDEEAWMAHGNPIAYHYCSECKNETYLNEEGKEIISDYCPFCGADMREEGADNG